MSKVVWDIVKFLWLNVSIWAQGGIYLKILSWQFVQMLKPSYRCKPRSVNSALEANFPPMCCFIFPHFFLALPLALPLSSLQTTFHPFCLDPSPLFSHSSLSLLFQNLIPLNKSNHSEPSPEPSFYSRTNQSLKTFPAVSPASLHLAANALGVERFPVCCYHLQMQDRCFSWQADILFNLFYVG